jgi:hypothetical protein
MTATTQRRIWRVNLKSCSSRQLTLQAFLSTADHSGDLIRRRDDTGALVWLDYVGKRRGWGSANESQGLAG